MTSRLLPVNLKKNNWFDGQQVTETDLTDEQTRNVGIDAALENNFFSNGVLSEFPIAPVIFDTDNLNPEQQSLLDSYSFDGQNVYTGSFLYEVSDAINGVNLAVQISNARLNGSAFIKVSIIGDSFGGDLIHDDLIFNLNGTQVSVGRYKNIRSILFNNFAGNLMGSLRFGMEEDGYDMIARCIIREAVAMEVSTDTEMAAQTFQPSIYWSSFNPSSSITVTQMLENAIGPTKSFSELNISLTSYDQRTIVADDVTTQIGQKFLATGNNIQKISVLLSVANDPTDGYDWDGSIVLTLHKLQTEVSCPVSPTPDTALDFDPDPTVISQIALDDDDLLLQGIVLSDIPQVVDFVFTGSRISDPLRSEIEENSYYVFTIGRADNPDTGTIRIEEATDRYSNGYMTIYDGTQWVNVVESDMWFVVYGDYIKISDGIAYDNGIGAQIPRLAQNSSNIEAPYILGDQPLYTVTYDAYNYVLLEVVDEFSDPVQDQRTGNQVYSRATSSPSISLINDAALTTLLETVSFPVFLSQVRDRNPRGNTNIITGETCNPGLVVGNVFNILRPDADILQNNLVGSVIYPSTSCGGSSCQFRIISQTHYNDAYGDVNGDGQVTLADMSIIQSWIDAYGSVDITNTSQHYLFFDGYIDTMQFLRADVNGDGVVNNTDRDLIEDYINKTILTFPAGSTFSRTKLEVENLLDPLSITADIPSSCCMSFTVPIVSCIPWEIDYFATWIPDLLVSIDIRRLLATTYTSDNNDDNPGGQNNFFIPGDLLLEGFILNPDSTFYSIDFEVNQLSLNIPVIDSYGTPIFLDGYRGLLLFDCLVAESSNGTTSSGFEAMKYADGSFVQIGDFSNGQVKITASLQSLTNEYGITMGGSIEDLVGLYYDPETSLLMFYIKDVYDDGGGNLIPSLSMKILVTVYLKHAGFINTSRIITADQMKTLLEI